MTRKQKRLARTRKRQRKAIYLQRGRVKRFREFRALVRKRRAKIGKRRQLIEQLRRELRDGPVKIVGNTATGGTPRERLEAVARAAALAHLQGRRKSFYSLTGTWTVDYAITGEPKGYRSDCSQWWISCYKSAGLPDPTGRDYKDGYTGTIGNSGRSINSGARKSGDAGLYGTFPHHHVEMCVDDGFVGHGSPPVDWITPGFPSTFRSYV